MELIPEEIAREKIANIVFCCEMRSLLYSLDMLSNFTQYCFYHAMPYRAHYCYANIVCLSVYLFAMLRYRGHTLVTSNLITGIISLGPRVFALRGPKPTIYAHTFPKYICMKYAYRVAVFSRKPAISLKRCKIDQLLLVTSNRKSHACFRLVPKIKWWPWIAVNCRYALYCIMHMFYGVVDICGIVRSPFWSVVHVKNLFSGAFSQLFV